ncbi:MAG: mechanosensitive ion channel [Deltaproteobacteria bacterium]|nr:MAG: mechanosensitive ion channel [Deltaproteobacteria bacterium]
MENIDAYTTKAIELVMMYAPKVVLAIITLIVGLWLIGMITKVTRKSMEKTKADKTLIPFITNLISWLLKVLLFISVASMVGIATTSFIAVLGAAGLAIGLALQGSLGNFAGGVLILIFKPYNVGDLIEAQGHLGVVKEVQIFNSILLTPDNKRVIIPNGAVSNGSIVNYSAEGILRIDMVIGIAYESDIPKAKEVLHKAMADHELVLKDPEPTVAVSELADSSVNFVVRPWSKVEDYWQVYFDITEAAKLGLEDSGISIPFPQRDVHLFEQKEAA